MKSRKCFRSFCAAGVLALALPLVSAGCKGSSNEQAQQWGPTPGMPGNMPGMPGMGLPGEMPPGYAPGMPGDMGGYGMPGGGAPAAPATIATTEPKITFDQMKRRFEAPPRLVVRKQPQLDKVSSPSIKVWQFRYRPKGDQEGFLPLVNRPTSGGAPADIPWLVELPDVCRKGEKTPGEWENLFCTYVVPDEAAIRSAHQALQQRLTQARRKLYGNRAYVLNLADGETLSSTARAHMNDAVANAALNKLQRATMYAALAQQSLNDVRRETRAGDYSAAAAASEQARFFQLAAGAALGDVAHENGASTDALWAYQQLSRSR